MSDGPFPVLEDGLFVAAASAGPARFGVFDTLLVEHGRAWFVERHLERLADACERFALPAFAARDVVGDLTRFVSALAGRTALVRTSAFRAGGAPLVRIEARAPRRVPADGVEALLVAAARDPLGAWKTTERAGRDRHAAEAERAGAFEALLELPGGEVVEAARANLFVALDGALATPPLARGALPGIVRGLLLEGLPETLERALSVDDLRQASEVFLASSGVRVAPLVAIRGLRSGLPGARGPVARRAAAALAAREAAYAAETRAP
ncbi:MAG: aminotransferase class IV [Planctomycetes bacterium]|nr:aminotransferase class IV [Planctomycetota bacterium]